MACLIFPLKIGHVGGTDERWRSAGLECVQGLQQRRPGQDCAHLEEDRELLDRSQLDGLVKERPDYPALGIVSCTKALLILREIVTKSEQ